MEYKIYDISGEENIKEEQLGSKEKFWYQNKDGRKFLFKFSRENTGEHWSEKISFEIAKLLNLPCAEYYLATRDNRLGIISPSFIGEDEHIIFGNRLLEKFAQQKRIKGVASAPQQIEIFPQAQHRIDQIYDLLEGEKVLPTRKWKPIWGINDGASLFTGYLMLDAIIGNTDRHIENWGVLQYKDNLYLAPTFDHASSLGRNELSPQVKKRLTTNDSNQTVNAYACRAKTPIFNKNNEQLTTIGVLEYGFNRTSESIYCWIKELNNLKGKTIERILGRFPDRILSANKKKFVYTILISNIERIKRIY